ncbi:MAG: rubrerythrin family protein [Candidatus Absconditabacterales bacterium]
MKKTLENLSKAFAGESQARNRYNIYAKIAIKEGYQQIGEIFNQTAEQEREHAGRFFKMIQLVKEKMGEKINEINVPTTIVSEIGDTMTNIQTAINGEHEEQSNLYPEFAKIAQEEGLPEVSARINAIIKAEMHHEERYNKLLNELKNNSIFEKKEEIEWACSKCGYVHKGKFPPNACPSCGHDKGYFLVKSENY